MERVSEMLGRVNLGQYSQAFEEEGYDDWDLLTNETEASRATICEDAGMSAEEAALFQSLFKAKSAEPLTERSAEVKKPSNKCPSLLVCSYGNPNDATQGTKQLQPLTNAAASLGIQSLVLHHSVNLDTLPKTWEAYVTQMVEQVQVWASATAPEAPIHLFCFSYGGPVMYAVAERLGSRVAKFYAVGCRAPHVASFAVVDDAWQCSNRDELRAYFHGQREKGKATNTNPWVGKKMEYMGNRVMAEMGSDKPAAWLAPLLAHNMAAYCDGVEPKLAAEIRALWGDDGEKAAKLTTPILAIAGDADLAETPARMERWRELTSSVFELKVIEGAEHQELIDTNMKTKEIGKGVQVVIDDLAKCVGDLPQEVS